MGPLLNDLVLTPLNKMVVQNENIITFLMLSAAPFSFLPLFLNAFGVRLHSPLIKTFCLSSDQDLLPLLATFRLEILDWDLWCIWKIYCNRAILLVKHFILYVSFVMDWQSWRLLGSKSLEQLANREHKLV